MDPNAVAAALLQMADDTMKISALEKQWALALQQAVKESDGLKPLTDFEYVQHAIVSQGNVQEALFRIRGLQAFREEYGIDHSLEQALDYLTRAMQMLPGFILHLDNCPFTNEAIMVWDASACYPEKVLSLERTTGKEYNWKTYVVAHYYMNYLCQPTLFAVRDGLTILIDCGDVSWNNVSMDFQKRMNDELRLYFPLRWKRILAYNTATIANIGWGLFKRLMPQNMRTSLKLGCQVIGTETDTRLRELFLQPSQADAKSNVIARATTLHKMRRENTANFRLGA